MTSNIPKLFKISMYEYKSLQLPEICKAVAHLIFIELGNLVRTFEKTENQTDFCSVILYS